MTILASSDEKLAVFAELDCRDALIMPLERENIAAFQQVEDLREPVFRSSDEEVARRMKVQRIHGRIVNSVILNQSTRFQVKDLDSAVLLSHRYDVVVAMPAQLVAEAFLVFESVNELASFGIENLHSSIFSTRGNHFVVGRQASASDPVGVPGIGVHEVAVREPEHFDGLVV